MIYTEICLPYTYSSIQTQPSWHKNFQQPILNDWTKPTKMWHPPAERALANSCRPPRWSGCGTSASRTLEGCRWRPSRGSRPSCSSPSGYLTPPDAARTAGKRGFWVRARAYQIRERMVPSERWISQVSNLLRVQWWAFSFRTLNIFLFEICEALQSKNNGNVTRMIISFFYFNWRSVSLRLNFSSTQAQAVQKTNT